MFKHFFLQKYKISKARFSLISEIALDKVKSFKGQELNLPPVWFVLRPPSLRSNSFCTLSQPRTCRIRIADVASRYPPESVGELRT